MNQLTFCLIFVAIVDFVVKIKSFGLVYVLCSRHEGASGGQTDQSPGCSVVYNKIGEIFSEKPTDQLLY